MPGSARVIPLRDLVPANFGSQVRGAREARGRVWTQRYLAEKVGVTREFIVRLEKGGEGSGKAPGVNILRALLRDDVLGRFLTFSEVNLPDVDGSERGLRAYAARRAGKTTLVEAARAAKTSTASVSLFERCLAAPARIVGGQEEDNGRGVTNDAYAAKLGFADAKDMSAYLEADDPLPWLARIAKVRCRPLLPAAILPRKREVAVPAPLDALSADLLACL